MPGLESTDDTRRIAVRGLTLEFRWTGDRWAHELILDPKRAASRVVRSFELTPDHVQPERVVSPSYQDLHLHDGEGPPRFLLVGQSGPHHFSAVFTVLELDGESRVDVDVADRCRSVVAGLGATYIVDLPSGDLRDADTERLTWQPGTVPGTLAFEAITPTRLAFAEAGRRATRAQADAPIDVAMQTHRLAYRWRWMA